MANDRSIRRYRYWYARLLRLYSKPYHERFGESMEQTFADRLRDGGEGEGRLFGCALWMSVETLGAVFRENMMRNAGILRIAFVTALLLLLPWVAMQITEEVVWDLADFVVAGVFLFGAGLTYELAARKGGTIVYRAAIGVSVATALILVWMSLAVGIIGPEGSPANLMYVGVLVVGVIGAIIARLQPRGMTRALFVTALAQVSVGVIALSAGSAFTLILNGFFAVMWVGSALLFRRAAGAQPA